MRKHTHNKAGFTLIELIAVIVVLAILGGVALPKYFDYSAKAKESACKGALGGVRAGVANWYANEAITNGTAAYPTLTELTDGSVMQEDIPDNPYAATPNNNVKAGTYDPDSDASTPPPVSGTEGWAYEAATGKFWANSDTASIDENEF